MIPPFTLSGLLPPFTGENPTAKALMSPYETSMVSTVQRFGTSAARFLTADLAAVSSLLEKRSEDQDPIGYLQLTARQSELEAEVARGSFGSVLEEAGQHPDHLETQLHREDVERGRLRADSLETEATEIVETGIISLLPDSRRFEFQSSDGQTTKRGAVAESCMARLLQAPERSVSDIVGQQVEARFLERTISQPSGAKRQTYRLVDIDIAMLRADA